MLGRSSVKGKSPGGQMVEFERVFREAFWILFCIGFYLSTESLIDSLINSHCVVIGCFETQHHYTA